MSASYLEDRKLPDGDVAGSPAGEFPENPKKDRNGIVLIPQPSDDPEDPLVRIHSDQRGCH